MVSKAGVIKEAGSSAKNKTGSWRTQKPVITDKCGGCSICIGYCPENAIKLNKNKKAEIDYDYCKGCMICANVCPKHAIKVEKEKLKI